MINLNELCDGAGSIAISGHVRPDGDCVGSTLGLYNYLKNKYPGKRIAVYLEKPSEIFRYLKGFDEIRTVPDECRYDLFFALDLGETERLGSNAVYFETAGDTVCIDHHISNDGFARHDYIVPDASSTSELVYTLTDESEIDKDIAECLYTGIIHDTGVFQYSNTSKRTMEIGGKLMSFGFDFSRIIDETFYEKTYVQNQIMGRALLESIIFMDGKCIASAIDKKTMDFYGATSKDLEGVVSQMRYTKGVDCAIFMYESGPMEYKVSMRSNGAVDVAKIAKTLGGGGHVRAAGFTMSGRYHDIINNISEMIEKQYESAK